MPNDRLPARRGQAQSGGREVRLSQQILESGFFEKKRKDLVSLYVRGIRFVGIIPAFQNSKIFSFSPAMAKNLTTKVGGTNELAALADFFPARRASGVELLEKR